MRLLGGGQFGISVTPDFWKMTKIIYKYLGMVADPPEEWEGYFSEEPPAEDGVEGFGIVEITLDLES